MNLDPLQELIFFTAAPSLRKKLFKCICHPQVPLVFAIFKSFFEKKKKVKCYFCLFYISPLDDFTTTTTVAAAAAATAATNAVAHQCHVLPMGSR